MSAFFGGRSGNLGDCAGPCRLPFEIDDEFGSFLSLKDLSLMDYLPELREMGVACVKIEGRMRTPEYAAAAVNAARLSLAKTAYDKELLTLAFSRSGFTDGFYKNDYLNEKMFGSRTEKDGKLTKEILPTLRALYRTELQRVKVDFIFKLNDNTAYLAVTDGTHTCSATAQTGDELANTPIDEAVQKSLNKTGGTPFICNNISLDISSNVFFSSAQISNLRRDVLDMLLAKRAEIKPYAVFGDTVVSVKREKPEAPLLYGRFDGDMPSLSTAAKFEKLFFPLKSAKAIPEEYRSKSVLSLPPAIFEEDEISADIQTAIALGFTAFEVQSICAIPLVKSASDNAVIFGGFRLNITNSISADYYRTLGIEQAILSPEITLPAANNIGGIFSGIIGYGHLPAMIIRSCPVMNVKNCASCGGKTSLIDRKGEKIAISCNGTGANGTREIYNPLPVYMGDRMHEAQTDFVTLFFTSETEHDIDEITKKFINRLPLEDAFTRLQYFK